KGDLRFVPRTRRDYYTARGRCRKQLSPTLTRLLPDSAEMDPHGSFRLRGEEPSRRGRRSGFGSLLRLLPHLTAPARSVGNSPPVGQRPEKVSIGASHERTSALALPEHRRTSTVPMGALTYYLQREFIARCPSGWTCRRERRFL